MTLILAGFAGGAQAVEFDEKVKAPMVRNGVELKTQAEGYSASYARLSNASPVEMVSSKALTQEFFEVKWQFERAIDAQRPLEDLSAVGLEKYENGLRIDFSKFPQWNPFTEVLTDLVPATSAEIYGPPLVARGFRDSDITAMRNYVESHNLKSMMSAKTLPLAISFSKVVKKYDKIKRPAGNDLVFAFLHQRGEIEAQVKREWAEGLIRALDEQRVRILHSYFMEMQTTGYWLPDDADAGVANMLAVMRLPDYEQRATAAAKGVAP
jgi:hypothetical protein